MSLTSDMDQNFETMRQMYGGDALIRLAAEECCELAQALLKHIRVRNGELTPVTPEAARMSIIEETSDVLITLGYVNRLLNIPVDDIHAVRDGKIARTKARLEG